jgi:hypothetical protein
MFNTAIVGLTDPNAYPEDLIKCDRRYQKSSLHALPGAACSSPLQRIRKTMISSS